MTADQAFLLVCLSPLIGAGVAWWLFGRRKE